VGAGGLALVGPQAMEVSIADDHVGAEKRIGSDFNTLGRTNGSTADPNAAMDINTGSMSQCAKDNSMGNAKCSAK
jgi:hypothetical protein